MNNYSAAKSADNAEVKNARSLLDELLVESRLYTRSKDFRDLLNFVVRLRNFAPFNAMLLQVQKPGLSYAATAKDWYDRFGRRPKEGARPLLILWPFGPVVLVYDVMDTEGKPLPEDVSSFFARGKMSEEKLNSFPSKLKTKKIEWNWVDAGDHNAGSISATKKMDSKKEDISYKVNINRNHGPAVQFTTLAHELGHLFLGHLGKNSGLSVPERCSLTHSQRELEAESVAYIVCQRNGIAPKSQTYLSNFVNSDTTIDHIDVYQVMRAAGQVESLLGLAAHDKFKKIS